MKKLLIVLLACFCGYQVFAQIPQAPSELRCDLIEHTDRVFINGEISQISFSNLIDKEQIIKAFRAIREIKNYGKKYFNLVKSILDIIVELNSDFTTSYINPQIKDLLGYSPEELIGKKSMDFIHPDDLPEIIKSIKKITSICNDEPHRK